MSILLDNQILQAAEDKIESQLVDEVKPNYEKVVVAGMKVALKDGKDGIMAGLRDSKDPISDCAVGAVKLVLMLRKQSRNTMPLSAMVPGAATLMLKALDFVARTKTAPVGNEELVRATRIFTDTLFKAMNVDMAKLTKITKAVNDVAKDPTAMEKIARRSGVVKDPNASSPTGLMTLTENPSASEAPAPSAAE